MNDLLGLFARHIEVSRLRVRRFSGVIFLCGGPTKSDSEDPTSARDFFLRRIRKTNPELAERIFLAEKVATWAQDMIRERYTPDLLTLESHLSSLASAVSLIVESPGSIAELGSFCLLPGARDRLMVVVREAWMTSKSFISLGPIAYLKNGSADDANPVYIYPWDVKWDGSAKQLLPNLADLSVHADQFIEDLMAFENNVSGEPKFDSRNSGHLSLLIGDLIATFSALKIKEIISLLEQMGIQDIDTRTIKGHLFLLEKLDLIKKEYYRSTEYYISPTSRFFIRYDMKNAPVEISDRVRFVTTVLEKIRSADRSRMFAIQRARRNEPKDQL